MADAEIEVIREILASHPRRKRLDALGAQYPLPPDVRVETLDANGVTAEMSAGPPAASATAPNTLRDSAINFI
jgi:epsilon-lactone hydrolase